MRKSYRFESSNRSGAVWSGLLALLLTGCVGDSYQAPISDRSEVLDQSPPEIVVSSDDSPSRYGGGSARAAESAITTPAASSLDRPELHVVRPGDSLYSIAFQYDLDVRALARVNNLVSPYTVFPGQQISLDLEQSGATPGVGQSSAASVGQVVGNNSVARAQPASSSPRGVIRQPIVRKTDVVDEEPQWRWPVRGPVLTDFQTDTSARKGIDIGAVAGQPVRAAAAGEVVYAGNGIQGSGNLIIVRHSERMLSAYAHNRAMLVSEGQKVRAGDTIGEAGTNAEGVSLVHFEIRLDGKPVDPLGYLPRL